jgi:hypothetical protein
MNYPNRIIRTGEQSAPVIIAIQQKLVAAGCGAFEFIGSYGPKTIAAVKLYQSTHRDEQGNLLLDDGEVGPITWGALFGPSTVPHAEETGNVFLKEMLEVARSQIGVMEVPAGSNSGPQVDDYLLTVNCAPGAFWCAAFVYWCCKKASKNLSRVNPAYKTGGCLNHWTETNGQKIPAAEAKENPLLIKPGFIFIIDHGKGYGHTGIVEKLHGGMMTTIEGNSNPAGGRNGLGVFRIFRKINSINKGFIGYN